MVEEQYIYCKVSYPLQPDSIPLCNGQNLQYLYKHFSVTSFLVLLHCTYDLWFFIVQLYRMYYLFYIALHQRFAFMCSNSTIVLYVFVILSFTKRQFRFLCSLLILFCCSDTDTPRPCNTNAIGASHCFPPPAVPQEPMDETFFS